MFIKALVYARTSLFEFKNKTYFNFLAIFPYWSGKRLNDAIIASSSVLTTKAKTENWNTYTFFFPILYHFCSWLFELAIAVVNIYQFKIWFPILTQHFRFANVRAQPKLSTNTKKHSQLIKWIMFFQQHSFAFWPFSDLHSNIFHLHMSIFPPLCKALKCISKWPDAHLWSH